MPSFDDIGKKQDKGKTEWLSLGEGQTVIRVLSTDYSVLANHWIDSEKKYHTCFGKDKGCPYDTLVKDYKTNNEYIGHRPNQVYLVWAIDRADGKIKITKLPYSVIKQIGDLKSSETYKFDKQMMYDISIMKLVTPSTKTKTGKETKYTVMPSAVSHLTDAELKMYEGCSRPSEIVQKMQDKEKRNYDQNNVSSRTTSPTTAAEPAMKDIQLDDDDKDDEEE